MKNTYYKLFWLFILFSVFGVASEGFYWILRYGHFDFRVGLIYGPFCEVYGFAVVLLWLVLRNRKDEKLHVLLIIAYITAVSFELLANILQEALFGYTSWEYSSKISLFGRANLLYAIPWAIAGVMVVRYFYPWFSGLMEKIPKKAGTFVTWALILFMVFDFGISAAAVHRYDERYRHISADNRIDLFLDRHFPDAYLEEKFARIDNGRK